MRVEFGEFVLDSGSRQLFRRNESIHLSRKAFDALAILLDRRPVAVSKEELHARLWPGTFVSDANLSVVISEIRRALQDEPQTPRFIRTVHRVGYAFCADTADGGAPVAQKGQPRAWLVWNDRTLPLVPGENLIGREPGCAVWLDAVGVSRRHARIMIRDDGASIEDVGSKNGTSLNGTALALPREVVDGDRITLGQAQLEYRTSSSTRETKTVKIRKER